MSVLILVVVPEEQAWDTDARRPIHSIVKTSWRQMDVMPVCTGLELLGSVVVVTVALVEMAQRQQLHISRCRSSLMVGYSSVLVVEARSCWLSKRALAVQSC